MTQVQKILEKYGKFDDEISIPLLKKEEKAKKIKKKKQKLEAKKKKLNQKKQTNTSYSAQFRQKNRDE